MVYPENIEAQNALRFLANQGKFSYQVYLITFSDLAAILRQRKNIFSRNQKSLGRIK